MNDEEQELTIEFLIQHLEIEDSNSHHKSLSQLDSMISVNFAAYDCKQNKGLRSKKNHKNGKHLGQKSGGDPKSSNSLHTARKPPDMERKCMRCVKHEHQPGQKYAAVNAKCKACGKIGHFNKVCMTTRRKQGGTKIVGNVQINEGEDAYQDEFGHTQPYPPPRVNMLRVINHLQTYQGKFSEDKYIKFKVSSHPSKSFDDHLVVRVDTGADVNCMNEVTYKALVPEVKHSVCPHEIQNFRNSIADISIPGQFHAHLQFKGKKV